MEGWRGGLGRGPSETDPSFNTWPNGKGKKRKRRLTLNSQSPAGEKGGENFLYIHRGRDCTGLTEKRIRGRGKRGKKKAGSDRREQGEEERMTTPRPQLRMQGREQSFVLTFVRVASRKLLATPGETPPLSRERIRPKNRGG